MTIKHWLICLGLMQLLLRPLSFATEPERLPLTRLSLGDIGGWIEVAVRVNGQPSRWLIDTGSTRHLVSAAFAERHGLVAGKAVRAETAIGPMTGREVLLPTLIIGRLAYSGQTALRVDDLNLLLGGAAAELDGVLGAPLLDAAALDFDLRRWTLAMLASPMNHCPNGTVSLPMRLHRGLPVITVSINQHTVESLVLDTGNPAAVVHVDTDESAAESPGIVLPGGVRLALAHQVNVGALARTEVPVMRLHASGLKRVMDPDIAGLAGTALMDGARWLLDLGGRQACVEQGRIPIPGGFGLTLAQHHGVLYVDAVLPGGPAQLAGLRSGEPISRWAGGAPDSPMSELWARVQAADEIEVQAGETPRTMRLRRAYFAPQLP